MATLIGWNLAALLKERGMSQKELAEAAGLTPASVSRYVNGERLPWPATIAAMSRALGGRTVGHHRNLLRSGVG